MTGPTGFYEPLPPDRELTADAVREVVREQFPDLAVATLERLGDGWEHEAYLVDGRVVFRFPRLAQVGRGFGFEERRLALVSSVVGSFVGIPRITRWGKPCARSPHPGSSAARARRETWRPCDACSSSGSPSRT